jgi:hypothetical protein
VRGGATRAPLTHGQARAVRVALRISA